MRGLLGLLMVSILGIGPLALRAIRHRRRTGSWGIVVSAPGSGVRERAAGGLFVLATLSIVLAPVLELGGLAEPLVGGPVVLAVGCVIYVVGVGLTIWSQETMGRAWRMGVDPSERTRLVTEGPFGSVRNPIYTGMLGAFLGVAAVVPNWAAAAGLFVLPVALQLQTRWVEEPHLVRTHGEAYLGYANRTGRFVPGVGRAVSVRPEDGRALTGPGRPSSRGSRGTGPPRRPRSS